MANSEIDDVNKNWGERASVISLAERKRREEAVNYARASVGFEGFKIGKAEEQHARRFINGEIDMPEFLKGRSNGASQER